MQLVRAYHFGAVNCELLEYRRELSVRGCCLATATAHHRSGTIEEFESSLQRRARNETPADILFYFIAPGAEASPEMRDYAAMLRAYQAPPLDPGIDEASRSFMAQTKESRPDMGH